MRTVTFSEARNHLKQVLDQVGSDADFTLITRRNASNAVVMSLDTFNRLIETVHLMKNPANSFHLTHSIEQHHRGEVEEHQLIDA